jgi:hypothetical protein
LSFNFKSYSSLTIGFKFAAAKLLRLIGATSSSSSSNEIRALFLTSRLAIILGCGSAGMMRD